MGRSEVGAAEGTTREGTAKRLKSVASVSVVLCGPQPVADGLRLCMSAGPWDRKVRAEESKGRLGATGHLPPAHCIFWERRP